MTNLEISKALALAIGHTNVKVYSGDVCIGGECFDYRDWTVIGPIAEKFDCFPVRLNMNLWLYKNVTADTPQKSIALAVIGTKK